MRIHRAIRIGEQPINGFVARGVVFDLADAEANRITTVQRGVALFEDFLEPGHDPRGFNVAGASQQCDELIAAQASDHVAFAKGNAQHIGEGLQRTVAFGMAVQIVDLLEVVEVEKQQRRRPVQARAGIQCMLGQLLETTAIGQQRQFVHACHLHRHQLLLGHLREVTQQRALFVIEMARLGINQAQGAHFVTVRHGQWVPGVKANIRRTGNQRIVMEAQIFQRIGDQHQLVLQNRMAAERDIAGRLADIQAHTGLEPLAIRVDQRDQGDRHVEQALGQARQTIEALFRGRVEVEAMQRVDTCSFIGRLSGHQHAHTP